MFFRGIDYMVQHHVDMVAKEKICDTLMIPVCSKNVNTA